MKTDGERDPTFTREGGISRVESLTGEDRRRVRAAIDELAALILEYAEKWGAEPTEKGCLVFTKAIRWLMEFGTGGIEANAKDHVFSDRITTRTYD